MNVSGSSTLTTFVERVGDPVDLVVTESHEDSIEALKSIPGRTIDGVMVFRLENGRIQEFGEISDCSDFAGFDSGIGRLRRSPTFKGAAPAHRGNQEGRPGTPSPC